MTTNQLRWAELVENKRHNLASEAISTSTLNETTRHNTEWERQNWYSAQAQAAYQRTQGQASLQQAGAAWQNAVTRQGELQENVRHNQVYEDIQQLQADTGWRNALTNAGKLTLEQNQWNSAGLAEAWSRADWYSTQSRLAPVNTGINAIGALGGAIKPFVSMGH